MPYLGAGAGIGINSRPEKSQFDVTPADSAMRRRTEILRYESQSVLHTSASEAPSRTTVTNEE